MRVNTTANLGAYLSTFSTCIPTILYATLLAGQYTTPAIFCEVTAVFTNTVPVDAYRGAGRPEATYVVERLVHQAAVEMGISQDDIRRRNFIRSFPYQTPVALSYDIGDYDACLDEAMKLADVAGFGGRKAESAKRGKLRGLGYASYIEACGIAPSNIAGALGARAGLYEAGEVRVHPTGSVSVFTGSHSHGQGHETTFAQLVAGRLGIPVENVDIVHGDTGRIPFGMGTYGSRSLAVGGTAIVKAMDKIVAKGKKIAAHLLEASEGDIEFADGKFTVAGTDRSKTFGEVALTAYVPHNYPLDKLEPGLNETAFYDPTNFTFPAGTHICEVEIDPDTGVVVIAKFSACDDFGNIINPMIVEGQVHGGLAQGIGQALLENCVYDPESGQLLSGSLMDYALPRADDLPSFAVATKVTPCTHNPIGAKGCGEAGAIGAPAALMNAVHDALASVGVTRIDMPASPHRVWQAIRASGGSARAPVPTPAPLPNAGEGKYQRQRKPHLPRVDEWRKPCTHSNCIAQERRGRCGVAGQERRASARRRTKPRRGDAAAASPTGHACRPFRHHRAARDPQDRQCAGHRCDGAACRGRRVERREEHDPGARGIGRGHRRPAGEEHGNARRIDRQQRSGGRLACRRTRAGYNRIHEQAEDRRRRLLHRPV